jgi:hypothetical protein
MLNRLYKNTLRFRLLYFFYVILLNFLLYTSINSPLQKTFNSNLASTISISSNTDYSLATLYLNYKKLDRQNITEYSEYREIHFSKYFHLNLNFLNNNLSLFYSIQIQNCITKLELLPSSQGLRSPPSLMA